MINLISKIILKQFLLFIMYMVAIPLLKKYIIRDCLNGSSNCDIRICKETVIKNIILLINISVINRGIDTNILINLSITPIKKIL